MAQVMFQTNNDLEDLGDFRPHVVDYVNDGYDRLLTAYDKSHVGIYPHLVENTDVPFVPEWMHRYLADWATWLVYRNGNPQKQSRGYAYRENFLSLLAQVRDEGGKSGETSGPYNKFRNIPK